MASPAATDAAPTASRTARPAASPERQEQEAECRGDHRQLLVHDGRGVLDASRVDERVRGDAGADREGEGEIGCRRPTADTAHEEHARRDGQHPDDLGGGRRVSQHDERDRRARCTGADPRAIG